MSKVDTQYQAIKGVIEHIVRNKLGQQSLDELSLSLGVSSGYVQKMFTQWVGVTPKQFGRYLSLQYSKDLLARKASTTHAALKTGLSGTGRLYDLFIDIEAMTPGEYQNKGAGLTISYSVFDTRFGTCLVASTAKGVCNILFADTPAEAYADLRSRWSNAKLIEKSEASHAQIERYFKDMFKSDNTKQRIKLHLAGTNLQLKVWEALLSIPEGEVASYGDIAKKISKNAAANLSRAVGGAVGANPIGYIIPCHRVLKSTGEISGYHWGIERKRAMLGYEAVRKNEI